MSIKDTVKLAYEAALDKKAERVKVLDIREVSIISDYFLIASGNNVNQVKAIADSVEDALAKCGVLLRHKEGHQTATWILLDFGSIIVHVFGKEERDFYDIEHIWGDAKTVEL